MLIIESFLHHFISFFGGNSLFDADLSPILGKISPEDGKTMVKECNMDDDYQRIAKHLLQKKKHNNPFLSGMANQLRVVVAVDQDLITTDQESLRHFHTEKKHGMAVRRRAILTMVGMWLNQVP